ncbi:MAG: hypothetical protein Q8O89_01070 [Nanoarchaeota archaeon]|nr:hypothetical protein [Nanoarchaeota archaeon]
MDARTFMNYIERCNVNWLGKLLNMRHTENGGIDLYDHDTGIELKCRYEKCHQTFTVAADQPTKFKEENPGKNLYWAFMIYDISKSPSSVKTTETEKIEKLIKQRDIWFFSWKHVNQFPVANPKTGPFIYIHKKDFPGNNEFDAIEVNKAKLYIPKGSGLEEKISNF